MFSKILVITMLDCTLRARDYNFDFVLWQASGGYDFNHLPKYHIHKERFTEQQKQEILKDAMFIFTNNKTKKRIGLKKNCQFFVSRTSNCYHSIIQLRKNSWQYHGNIRTFSSRYEKSKQNNPL